MRLPSLENKKNQQILQFFMPSRSFKLAWANNLREKIHTIYTTNALNYLDFSFTKNYLYVFLKDFKNQKKSTNLMT